ncbi:MAG: SET domain-containing protein [Ginsengibacter sp.]
MALLEKYLKVKRSGIPGAGKGLFTKQLIKKGTRILEYKGRITTWKDVLSGKNFNGYVYYINRNYVIDAMRRKTAIARFANDARGLNKTKGVSNNAEFVVENKRVYICAKKKISEGEEILVSYGKEYWKEVVIYIKSLEVGSKVQKKASIKKPQVVAHKKVKKVL